MNGLYQPLLNSIVLVLRPELLHLLCRSLRYHFRLLDVLPKSHSIEVVRVV